MKLNKTLNALALLFLLTRSMDLAATVQWSDDLKYEGNPLILALGNTWSSVFLVQAVVVLIYVYFWRKVRFNKYPSVRKPPNFVTKLFYFKTKDKREADFSFLFMLSTHGCLFAVIWWLSHHVIPDSKVWDYFYVELFSINVYPFVICLALFVVGTIIYRNKMQHL